MENLALTKISTMDQIFTTNQIILR